MMVDGQFEEYAELMFYIAQDIHERDQERLYELWGRQQADIKSQRLQSRYIPWR